VRNENQGRKVKALSYDSFVPLAEETLKQIARESQQRWGLDLNISVLHRVGKLDLNERAVVLAISSRHRAEAYKASQYIISELKKRAPIWKKEHYFDGDSEWLQGHALCGHDHSHEMGSH
jgi:molybdopterin synthase catalytic subunit